MNRPRGTGSKPTTPARTRREEIRRTLPKATFDLSETLRRPGVLNSIAFVLLVAVAGVLVADWASSKPQIHVGRIAVRDRLNPVAYEVVDAAATAGKRDEAKRSSPRIYRPNTTYLDRLRAAIEGLPVAVHAKTDVAEIDSRVREEFALSEDGLKRLQEFGSADGPLADWRLWTSRFIRSLEIEDPLLASGEYQLFATTLRKELVVPAADGSDSVPEVLRTAVDLAPTDPAAIDRALSRLADRAGFPGPVVRFVVAPILRDPKPTILFDAASTAAGAESAAGSVEPVLTRHPQNEIIIARGEEVTPEKLARYAESISQARLAERLADRVGTLAGLAGLFALAASLAVFGIAATHPAIARNPGRMLGLLALTSGFAAIGVAGVVEMPRGGVFAVVLVSMLGGMIATLCYDRRLGAIVTALLVGILVLSIDRGFAFALAVLVPVGVAVANLREVRHRACLVRAGARAAIAAGGSFMLLGLIEVPLSGGGWMQPVVEGLFGASAALAASFLMLGILPSLERLFDVATGLTLSELRDPRQPLLRLIQQRAPGTYSHSLQIATLAEAAADAIGADGLLVYVGALYHDIGKVNKPDYFIENQSGGPNRHEKLSPAMSLLVIVGHVKDGLALAKEHGLPKVLHHFIESHHGTTLVEYFYRAAQSRAEALGEIETSVQEFDFRYPGPKPRSREAAILMLCDAAESASRTLHDPSPGRLEALVRKLSRSRLEDGQFDECSLTFRQLRQVEDSIVKSLVSIHHGRIGYQSTASIAEPAAEDESASETSAADADGEAATSAESTAPVDSVPARTSAG
ncbi:MAG: HDIG domain-containing metalloprotein [Phycisphaerales bacterium]|jgi:putative nucleotidyltransferase with HDIG domain